MVLPTGHKAAVNSCSYSPDGKFIHTASYDNTLKIWNARTGYMIHDIKNPDNVGFFASVYSPDGKYIVAGAANGTIYIYDASNAELLHTIREHTDLIYRIRFNNRGDVFYTASKDNFCKAFSIDKAKKLWEYETGWWNALVRVSPDDRFVLTGTASAVVLNAKNGKKVLHLAYTKGLVDAQFSPDSKFVIFGSPLTKREISTNTTVDTLDEDLNFIFSAEYNHDSSQLAVADRYGKVGLFNITNGQLIHLLKTGNQSGAFVSDAIMKACYINDSIVIGGGEDKKLRSWNTNTGQLYRVIDQFRESILDIVLSPGRDYFCVVTAKGEVVVYNSRTLMTETTLTGSSLGNEAFHILPDDRIDFISEDKIVQWDMTRAQPSFSYAFNEFGHKIKPVYSKDGKYVAYPYGQLNYFGGDPTPVRVHSTKTGKLITTLYGHQASVYSLLFTNKNHLITGSSDGTVRIWDIHTGKELSRTGKYNGPRALNIALSKNERYMYISDDGGRIKQYDVSTGKLVTFSPAHCANCDIYSMGIMSNDRSTISMVRGDALIISDFDSRFKRSELPAKQVYPFKNKPEFSRSGSWSFGKNGLFHDSTWVWPLNNPELQGLTTEELYYFTKDGFYSPEKLFVMDLKKFPSEIIHDFSGNFMIIQNKLIHFRKDSTEIYDLDSWTSSPVFVPFYAKRVISGPQNLLALMAGDSMGIWDMSKNKWWTHPSVVPQINEYSMLQWNKADNTLIISGSNGFNLFDVETSSWIIDSTSNIFLKTKEHVESGNEIRKVIYNSRRKFIYVYDKANNLLLFQSDTGNNTYNNVLFPRLSKNSEDGRYACWGNNQKLMYERRQTGDIIQTWNLPKNSYLKDVHFLRGDTTLLIKLEKAIHCVSTKTGKVRYSIAKEYWINPYYVDQESDQLLYVCRGKLYVHNLITGALLDSVKCGSSAEEIGASPDRRYISIQINDEELQIFDRNSLQLIKIFPGTKKHSWVTNDTLLLGSGRYGATHFMKMAVDQGPVSIQCDRIYKITPTFNDSFILTSGIGEKVNHHTLYMTRDLTVLDKFSVGDDYYPLASLNDRDVCFKQDGKKQLIYNSEKQKLKKSSDFSEIQLDLTGTNFCRVYHNKVEVYIDQAKRSFSISDVVHVALNPDKNKLLFCLSDAVQVLDLDGKALYKIGAIDSEVEAAWFLPGDELIAVKARTLSIYDSEGILISSLDIRYKHNIEAQSNGMIYFTTRLRNGDRRDSLDLLSLAQSGTRISDQGGYLQDYAVLSGQKELITAEKDGMLYRWDIASSSKIESRKTGLDGIFKIYLNEDSSLLAVTGSKQIEIYRIKDLSLVSTCAGHSDQVNDIGFNTAYDEVMSLGDDHLVRVWEITTGKLKYEIINLGKEDFLIRLPDGKYFSSKDAARQLYYLNADSDPISFDQLDAFLNRPHEVLSNIVQVNPKLLEVYQKAYAKRQSRLKVGELDINHLPQLEFVQKDEISFDQQTDSIQLRLVGQSTVSELQSLVVWVNDNPVLQTPISGTNQLDTTIWIQLSDGLNRIEGRISDSEGRQSFKKPLLVDNHESSPSKLYFVGIGMEHFANPGYELNYCVKDIRDITAALHERYGDQMIIDTIFNEDFTLQRLDSVRNLLQGSGINDRVIICYSGHGLLDKDLNYYLSGYGVDFDHPENGGIPYSSFEALLSDIPARKKLMLLDACHSGEIDKTESYDSLSSDTTGTLVVGGKGAKVKNLNPTIGLENSFELMQELFINLKDGTGATIISAASGTQFAFEKGDLNNGVFTFAVLELLNNPDPVTVMQLKRHVGKRVEEITHGKQKPTSRTETRVFDWEL